MPIKSLLQQVMVCTFFLACLMLRLYCLHQTWDHWYIKCYIKYFSSLLVNSMRFLFLNLQNDNFLNIFQGSKSIHIQISFSNYWTKNFGLQVEIYPGILPKILKPLFKFSKIIFFIKCLILPNLVQKYAEVLSADKRFVLVCLKNYTFASYSH